MKRISIGSWAYTIGPYEKDPIDFDTVCRTLSGLGFDGVELGGFPPHPNPTDLPDKARREAVVATMREHGLAFSGLAANDSSQIQYQLWIFDAGRDDRYPVDGGGFDVPAGVDEVVVPIQAKLPVGEVALFAVTVEKPGGVVVSSRERIAVLAQPPGA